MKQTESTNIPVLSIDRTVSLLSASYMSVIQNGVSPKTLPSVMLWGPPGVGKSQAVRQIAKQIENESGKRVDVTDVRLLLFNPIDLRGIPVANEDRTLAVWLKPKIFQMDGSDEAVNILFSGRDLGGTAVRSGGCVSDHAGPRGRRAQAPGQLHRDRGGEQSHRQIGLLQDAQGAGEQASAYRDRRQF